MYLRQALTVIMQQLTGLYIKKLFDPYFEAPISVWEDFSKKMIHRSFKKNEIIKDVDETEKYIDIIIEGSIGVFLWTDNHARCVDLFYEEDFSCDYMSYLECKPSELFTQALEDTQVFSISRQNIDELYDDNVIGLKIMHAATGSLFVHKQQQQIALLTMTAEERYKYMMEEAPEILQRTASKHIASYLGVTPESLSRIRNKYG